MEENKSSIFGSFNWTSVVALFTVVGGIFMASQPVHSDRPNAPAEGPHSAVGDQQVLARLWEDPLGTHLTEHNDQIELEDLRRQLGAFRPHTRLLPVMVHGGSYSEDHESRVRSRYAVVSALGEAGYVPEDAEHIGVIRIGWPRTTDLLAVRTNLELSVANLNGGTNGLSVSFEWYRSRAFRQGSHLAADEKVLLLWLDEDKFSDYPLARLVLLLNEFVAPAPETNGAALASLFDRIALVGPVTSGVLRGMLPPYGAADYPIGSVEARYRRQLATVLQRVDVYCATASAMDEVLVDTPSLLPRAPVEKILTNDWFHSFHGYCATDAQLAAEALAELKLRQIDLSNTGKNLVLISEWDTFFGRMLWLTYAAELAKIQHLATNNIDFVSRYLGPAPFVPTNLHSYVYLRGLDGQTTGASPPPTPADSNPSQFSLLDLKRGDQNLNKAEGEAQFDYLSRLGGHIRQQEVELESQGRGHIDAIGIVGSDVYDTLVILQTLRPMFKNTVFFTTGLDARFLHPQEEEWSRNLLVFSSYGFRLRDDLQGGVAPFRSGEETAQFAATLAALGSTNAAYAGLSALAKVPPRRFEIGRSQAVDLSVANGDSLHPPPAVQRRFTRIDRNSVLGILLLAGGGLFLAVGSFRTLQRMTWDHAQYEAKALWFVAEDLNHAYGLTLLDQAFRSHRDDPLVAWLLESYVRHNSGRQFLVAGPAAMPMDLQTFLDFLNQFALLADLPVDAVARSKFVSDPTKEQYAQAAWEKPGRGILGGRGGVARLRLRRLILGELFTATLEQGGVEARECALAQKYSRQAGLAIHGLQRNSRLAVWVGLAVFIASLWLLMQSALSDNGRHPEGEPLSFSSGASVWPTEALRLVSIFVTLAFFANAYASLRSGIFELSRRYRLPLTAQPCKFKWRLPAAPSPQSTVDAADLWTLYQQLGRFWPRLGRTAPLLAAYIAIGIGLAKLGELPYSPVRGDLSKVFDSVLLLTAVLVFLFLAFWISDAARLCRWLIEHLSQAPTRYPASCLRFFAEQRGLGDFKKLNDDDLHLLGGWIDMQLIASLTERVGRLVYYPFIVFFILLVSRSSWWDRWAWTPALVVIFGLNLLLAVSSIFILQSAALRARAVGLQNLEAQAEAAESAASPSPEMNRATIARRLVEEVKNIKQGAFAPFWENPLVGALLIPSGGSVLLELLVYLFGQ